MSIDSIINRANQRKLKDDPNWIAEHAPKAAEELIAALTAAADRLIACTANVERDENNGSDGKYDRVELRYDGVVLFVDIYRRPSPHGLGGASPLTAVWLHDPFRTDPRDFRVIPNPYDTDETLWQEINGAKESYDLREMMSEVFEFLVSTALEHRN